VLRNHRCSSTHCVLEQLVFIVPVRNARQFFDFRVRQLTRGKRRCDCRQYFQGVGNPHFLTCGCDVEVAAPGEPLGAVLHAPLVVTGTLVKLANKHQQLVRCCIDLSTQIEDALVEFFERAEVGSSRFHDGSLSY